MEGNRRVNELWGLSWSPIAVENKTKEIFEGKERKGKVKQKEASLGLRYHNIGRPDGRKYLPRNEEKEEEDISRLERYGDSDRLMYVLTLSLFLLSLSFPEIYLRPGQRRHLRPLLFRAHTHRHRTTPAHEPQTQNREKTHSILANPKPSLQNSIKLFLSQRKPNLSPTAMKIIFQLSGGKSVMRCRM